MAKTGLAQFYHPKILIYLMAGPKGPSPDQRKTLRFH